MHSICRFAAKRPSLYLMPSGLRAFFKEFRHFAWETRWWVSWRRLCTRPGSQPRHQAYRRADLERRHEGTKAQEKEGFRFAGGRQGTRKRPPGERGEETAGASCHGHPGLDDFFAAFVATRKRPDFSEEPAGPLRSQWKAQVAAELA
jgi:hypothetical protein